MRLYEDIQAEINGWRREKYNDTVAPEICDCMINVFKSVRARADILGKERKLNLITNDVMFEAITKEIKELTQTIELTPKDTDAHRIAALQREAIQQYAPKKLTLSELKEELTELVEENNFTNFGEAMKFAREKFKFTADGKDIAKILKEIMG